MVTMRLFVGGTDKQEPAWPEWAGLKASSQLTHCHTTSQVSHFGVVYNSSLLSPHFVLLPMVLLVS